MACPACEHLPSCDGADVCGPSALSSAGTVWLATIGRRRFYPLNPQPEQIGIDDIAHALSLQCRFGGHVPVLYSVAQHSCYVSYRAEQLAGTREAARWGLLHDAAEAYIVDVPRPVKRQLTGYAEIEHRVMAAIAERFGLEGLQPQAVKQADEELLATEGRDLFAGGHDSWSLAAEPLQHLVVRPWTAEVARARFLARFAELFACTVTGCTAAPHPGSSLCWSHGGDLVQDPTHRPMRAVAR